MYRRRSSPSQKSRATEETRRRSYQQGAIETAKIALPSSWKGFVTIGESSPPPPAVNFAMGLYALNPESHFRGIIFRNTNPIKDIRPFGIYGANKDALSSLQSLDNRLNKEYLSMHQPNPKSSNDSASALDSQSVRKSHRSTSAHTENVELARSSSNSHRYMNTLAEDLDVVELLPETKQDSMSLISSSYLDLSDLETSINQSRQSKLSFYANRNRAPSIFSENFDNYSLISSTGSLAFDSRESRRVSSKEINSPRYPDEQLVEISKLVKQMSDKEGRQRNHQFQSVFQNICDVINAIICGIPSSVLPFNIKKVETSGHYATTGLNSFEIYLIPCIQQQDFQVSFSRNNASQANVYLVRNNPSLELFCVFDESTNQRKLSPCKLMIIFAHIFNTSAKDSDVDGATFPHGAHVYFDDISEKAVQLTVQFRFSTIKYKISLILALDIDSFPASTAQLQHRDWPLPNIQQRITQNGVHLTARLADFDMHAWKVTFLKPRQTLLQGTDETGNKLRLLLALQCLRETSLSQPGIILPSHLATLLFWASIKYRAPIEWTTEKLGKRFLDLVVALRRCLWKRECADFFIPNVNMFAKISRDDSYELLLKIDEIIKDPLTFLKLRSC